MHSENMFTVNNFWKPIPPLVLVFNCLYIFSDAGVKCFQLQLEKKENSVFFFIIYVCVEGRLTKQARFYVFMGDHTLDEYEGVSPALHSQ